MNETIRTLLGHRTIRRFSDEPVLDADVRVAVEAGQRASTSSAVQAYCLIRVRDAATRAELVALTGGQEKVAEAGAFFVVCADGRRHRLLAARAGAPYDTRFEAFLVGVIDAALFAQNVCVAFESLGYGICYVGGLRNALPRVDALLEIPEGVYPLFGLCVGRPAQEPALRPRLAVDAVLFEERYPDDETVLAQVDAHDEAVRRWYETHRGRTLTWSEGVAKKHAKPVREDVAPYYAKKGANLS